MKSLDNYVVVIIFFNSILVSCCSILNITTEKFEVYHDIQKELFTKCHPDYHNVIVYDDRHKNLYLPSAIPSPSYIRINSSTKYNYDQIEKIQKTTQIDAVIMTIYTSGFVRNLIVILKSLRLLDIATPIFIFSRQKVSCFNRKVILEIAWDFELLSIFFICVTYINQDEFTLIYTFNPYASYAPRQWFLLTKFIVPNNPARFFNRIYKKGNLCQGFDFDRTRYINNTVTIKLGIELDTKIQNIDKRLEWNYFSHKLLVDEIFHEKIILKLLEARMNTGYEATFINYETIIRRKYDNLLKDAYNFKVDLILFNDVVVGYQNFTMSYPFKIMEYKIVALERDFKNFLEYIYYILGFPMFIMMVILIILTFFVVWLSNRKKTISFACFEIIRLLIDASLEINMNTASLKIFFMTILFYFMFIQTLFQGELANFFTNPPRHKFPDSIEKLISLQYKRLYYPRSIADYMKPFKTPNNHHWDLRIQAACNKIIMKHEMTACIIENKWAHILAMFYLKISPVVHRSYQFYITRNDSPFKNRINHSFLLLWELGFASLMSDQENNAHLGFITRKAARQYVQHRRIKNRHLKMMFIFLGIGLSLATLSFFFELIIHNRKKIRKSIVKKFFKIRNKIECDESDTQNNKKDKKYRL